MLLFLVLILVNISIPNECLQHGLIKLTLFTQNNVIYIRVLYDQQNIKQKTKEWALLTPGVNFGRVSSSCSTSGIRVTGIPYSSINYQRYIQKASIKHIWWHFQLYNIPWLSLGINWWIRNSSDYNATSGAGTAYPSENHTGC
jgi:hypothetical protein